MATMADIGRRLAQHRGAQRMTQAKLAELAQVSIGTVYRAETGQNAYWATINVLRTALGMTPEDLEHDLVMGRVHDIHPGGSAEKQSKESLRAGKPATSRGV